MASFIVLVYIFGRCHGDVGNPPGSQLAFVRPIGQHQYHDIGSNSPHSIIDANHPKHKYGPSDNNKFEPLTMKLFSQNSDSNARPLRQQPRLKPMGLAKMTSSDDWKHAYTVITKKKFKQFVEHGFGEKMQDGFYAFVVLNNDKESMRLVKFNPSDIMGIGHSSMLSKSEFEEVQKDPKNALKFTGVLFIKNQKIQFWSNASGPLPTQPYDKAFGNEWTLSDYYFWKIENNEKQQSQNVMETKDGNNANSGEDYGYMYVFALTCLFVLICSFVVGLTFGVVVARQQVSVK